jgi:HK97 family phage prohead protease
MNRFFLAGQVKALDDDGPNGSFEVILSAPTLDRDGEVVDAGAFEPLPDHITFDVDHGMSTTTTVGSGRPTYEDGNLVVRGTFASTVLAQETRALVKDGHIRTTSVAYMTPKYEVKDGVRHIVKAELLNGAFVAVPANRQALVLAAKGFDRPGARPGLKAVEGSYEARREQLSDAVRVAHPDAWWTYVVATFDDSIVYEVEGRGSSDRFQADYTIGDDGDVTLTNVRTVEVVEVIQPTTESAPSDTPETEAAAAIATAASSPAAVRRAQVGAALAPAEALLASAAPTRSS